MLLTVPAVLPDSTLAPQHVAQKFKGGFAGLGCDCATVDDDGNCLDPEPCSDGASENPTVAEVAAMCANEGLDYSGGVCVAPAYSGTSGNPPNITSAQTCASFGMNYVGGNCVTPSSPSGKTAGLPANTAYSPANVFAAAVGGALDVAKLMVIQPGTAQGGGVTQRVGLPVVGPGSSAVNIGGMQISSTMLMVAALGIGAILLMSQRGR